MQETDLLVSVEEAARRLAVGRTAAYALIKSGVLPTVKLGRRRLVVVESLPAVVDHLRTTTS